MRTFLRQNAVFLTLSLILVVVLGLALLYIPKGELHWLLCSRHTCARDIFYKYYTQIGEWLPYVFCALILFLGRVGDGVLATSGLAVSGLLAQGLKYIANADRPLVWFATNMPDVTLPLVDGVQMSRYYSFPSGHTTSFFALAFVLCLLATRYLAKEERTDGRTVVWSIAIQFLCFIAATLGAYSRIYLSQHFASDILGGVVLGLITVMLCYAIFSRFEHQKWYNYRFFEKK